MGADPIFTFAHSASSLTLQFFANGAGWQGGQDEAWAIENIQVVLDPIPEPSSILLVGSGILAVAPRLKRRRRHDHCAKTV